MAVDHRGESAFAAVVDVVMAAATGFAANASNAASSPFNGAVFGMETPDLDERLQTIRCSSVLPYSRLDLFAVSLPLQFTALPFLTDHHIRQALDKVTLCAKQHPSHQVRRADSRRPLDDLHAPRFLDKAVAVVPVSIARDIVAVHDILTSVMGDPRQAGHVRRMWDTEGAEPAGVHGGSAFREVHDGRAFVLGNLLV